MNDIEKRIEHFRASYSLSLQELSPVIKKNYLTIFRMLVEKEQMPKETLLQLARRIKPLMSPKKGSTLKKGLYWSVSQPLKESFYYNFGDDSVVKGDDGKIVPVRNLQKVCEFTCYHRYGGYYGCLRPGMDEIIQQFPAYLLSDSNAEFAVKLIFPSDQLQDVYDVILDRHVSTVVVYRMMNGLPKEVREQDVVYE